MSKPGKVLRNLCKKLGVRLTVKRGKKRVYKSVAVLKRQCANKKKVKKKKKVKRKRKFGTRLATVSSGSFKFDQPYDVLHESDGSFLTKETLTLNKEIENLKNKLLDKWEKSPKETIERNFTAKKYPQKIPFMSSTNEEIEVTEDGRLFFKNGLYEIEGNIDIIIGKDGKHYWPENKEIRKWQEKTFNKLESRKDILPYPLDKFLQAFKNSERNLKLAKYIVILSKKNFPYNEYKYRTTMRYAKKLVSFYYPKVKFGRKRKKTKRKKVKRKRKKTKRKKVKRKRKFGMAPPRIVPIIINEGIYSYKVEDDGRIKIIYIDDSNYHGEFKIKNHGDGKYEIIKHGKGRLYKKGVIYDGEWENDRKKNYM